MLRSGLGSNSSINISSDHCQLSQLDMQISPLLEETGASVQPNAYPWNRLEGLEVEWQ